MTSTIPLASLGRLNTHARAIGEYMKFAIYAYKTVATLVLAEEKALSLRLIRWKGKCNRCTAGRFHHYSWPDGYTVACRDCRGAGWRTLHFTETTLPDGQVWHHPWDGVNSSGRRIAEAFLGDIKLNEAADGYVTAAGEPLIWREPGEWAPNLPATKLKLAELLPLLNEVEDWIEALPNGGPHNWPIDLAKRHLGEPNYNYDGYHEYGYKLHIGRTSSCFVCGAPDAGYPATRHYGRMTRQLDWSLPLCASHGDVPFPKDPPPAELITPDIRHWLDRHERKDASQEQKEPA